MSDRSQVDILGPNSTWHQIQLMCYLLKIAHVKGHGGTEMDQIKINLF